jgi:DNA-binding response OmpR family regulator
MVAAGPASPGEPQVCAQDADTHRRVGYASRGRAGVARVLVIDDEPDVLLLCRVNLEHEGHEVLLAAGGAEGMELARSGRPDVIVLDLMMPQMDGYDVLRELSEDAGTRGVPVLILTARARTEDQLRGWRAGAAGYLTKPFAPLSLTDDVDRLEHATAAQRDSYRAEAVRSLTAEVVA